MMSSIRHAALAVIISNVMQFDIQLSLKGVPQMARATTNNAKPPSALIVRLSAADKRHVAKAAELRRVSISDYVRSVTVAQVRREIESATTQTIRLSPGEQLAFWNALQQSPQLTSAQRRLGAVMRGDA
jgi:uncharacterized protein (DUF1778 family)